MKILRLYPFIPPRRGGIELHVRNLTTQQRLMDHEVTLLFNQGLATHFQDVQIARKFNLHRIKPQILRDLFFYVSALIYCFRKNLKPDFIHVHGDWSAFLLGALIAYFVRPRFCMASIHSQIQKSWIRKIYPISLARYDAVYCTGYREAKLLQSLGIKHAYWQPSGVAFEFSECAQSMPMAPISLDVICIANLLPVKNLDLLIKVAHCLPNYRFEVIGDGPLREQLKTTCCTLGVDNVNFVGSLNRTSLAKRLSCAQIFYLPSLSEGTPTAMMEAMTMGLPIVVTPSNDYQNIVNEGVNGYVTRDFSVESSVQAITQLLDNPVLMAEMSQHNRATAERFTWPFVAKRITALMHRNTET